MSWPNRLRSLLSACKHSISVSQVHGLSVTSGVSTDRNFTGHLIASYAKNADIVAARHLFDASPDRALQAWNSIIIAYSRSDEPEQVLNLYKRMLRKGVRPDSSTFTLAIKACSSLMDWESGEIIWGQAVGFGYSCDLFVGSSVLNLFAKCGEMGRAKALFDGTVRKDVVCWTSMIMGYVRCGKAAEAVNFYRKMQEEGIGGDGVEMLGLIQASAYLGNLKLGLSVHGYMVRREMISGNVPVQTSLLDMYAKNGKLETASRVFKKMLGKSAVSWGALISGFAQNGFAQEALELLIEMKSSGYRPDSAALVSALLACSQVGYLKLGKSVHGYILRNLCFEQVLDTGLIDMYAKCGALPYARRIFDLSYHRDLIMWNTMIAGYGIHGHGKEALSIFMKMKRTNISLDHVTFAALLSALSHSGLVEEGLSCFDTMINECKIQPSENHYASMIDLLSRAGRLEEAYRLIKLTNTKQEHPVWVALLSGCYNYKNISIGEIAAQKILESKSDDPGVISLLSNFFSMARKWDDVASLRKIMKRTETRKVPGYSAVEVNGQQLAFVMEDTSFRQRQSTVEMLDCLFQEMKLLHVHDIEFVG